MISFRFNTQIQPPAPFCYVNLRPPGGSEELRDVPAQLDTAANMTVIPIECASKLRLKEMRQIPVAGFAKHVERCRTFLLNVQIRGLPDVATEVIEGPGEPFVLLGRDVLNHFRVILDGTNQSLTIE